MFGDMFGGGTCTEMHGVCWRQLHHVNIRQNWQNYILVTQGVNLRLRRKHVLNHAHSKKDSRLPNSKASHVGKD